MVQWPDGARCAVTLTFDFDAETNWLARDPANARRPGTLSQGTYGARVGVPRILDLLRHEGLPATFFVPGWVAEERTERVEAILAAGHEIGHHGYLHRWVDPDRPDEEVEEMERGLAALKSRLGVKPSGYRSPAGEVSPNLIRLLVENGFLYDSSLMDSIEPYHHVMPDGAQGPVELPWHWSLDDAPYLFFSLKTPKPILTNEHILSIWQAEFRAIHEQGALFNLVMHPQGIGRPSRLAMLRDFIAFTRTFEGVWYASAQQVAAHWRAAVPYDPADGRINPFIAERVPNP
ncbi:polysaccharide deacetylase [Aquibium sp. A9E412]|uniref:polysaccharide deacetylase family protein n=1 Tax=Aquibium sp. A9E412 TaxID=2976767 RepID=UPI0025B0E182|nr:polysaccharide deacetylase [Aquibium sp. A9E412]MDN2567759.1 polysaccharide deacetylase [Aquibium sp. A9E412]